MTPHDDADRRARFELKHGYAATPEHCAAMWPTLGYQCELEPGHRDTHERITSGAWLSWCDAHADGFAELGEECHDYRCDLRARGARK